MDKLIHSGKTATVTNDGATVMKLLNIVHPAASTLVDIAKSQDAQVGDGTTSVVVLAASLLSEAKGFLEDGVHPQIIVNGYRSACMLARALIQELAVTIDRSNAEEFHDMLIRCAQTSLNSKLLHHNREFFARMAVGAVERLDEDMDLELIGIKKETGGALEDSLLVSGVAFKKCFSYAGFEQQPKRIPSPKILCLNIELELKAERDNIELRIEDPSEYQSLVDAEWAIIYRKLDHMIAAGCNVILSRLPIGDLATQYFADRNVFCAGRVSEADLKRVARATGAQIQTTVENIIPDIIGHAELFEEKQVGKERYNFVTGCASARAATIILRGGGDQFTAEAERSLHDSIMIVRRARKHHTVVAGGGAIEMEIAERLRKEGLRLAGKQQLMYMAFARALEAIPRNIAANGGYDSIELLNQLRHAHAQPDGKWIGLDMINGATTNTFEQFVWEPSLVKFNAITAATEAAALILSIDETVRNSASAQSGDAGMAMPGHGH
jgi:T-complex protein 1 subunit eta